MIHSLSLKEKLQKLPLIQKNLNKHIIGLADAKQYILKAFLTGQHILLEGAPGIGKTELAKAFAEILEADYKRIQGTPDLMPQDILGYTTANGKEIKGPIYTNILLVDEINRINPKTQSALLSAMSEKKVIKYDGTEEQLSEFFIVIATENPLDDIGTYQLPNSAKNRFGVKIILKKEPNTLWEIYQKNRDFFPNRHLNHDISENIIELVQDTFDRLDPSNPKAFPSIVKYVAEGPSNRAGIQFIDFIQASALISNRSIVSMEDVSNEFLAVFRDKIKLNEEAENEGVTVDQVLNKIFNK